MTDKQPNALQLADALEAVPTGCTCYAHGYCECGCVDAVWPEMSMKPAATELRRLGPMNTKQAEQLKAITHLVHQLHQAKGRYHTQNALCALFDAFGLPNVKPERKTK